MLKVYVCDDRLSKASSRPFRRFANENPSWGYDRIQGALANVGHHISDTTVGNVLKQHGIEPAPNRRHQTTWATFIKSHWDVLAAIDFTTMEVWTKGGRVTCYLLFVMEMATRCVHLAACSPTLGDDSMKQLARNLTDPLNGALKDKQYVLMDRDPHFSCAVGRIRKDAGAEPVRLRCATGDRRDRQLGTTADIVDPNSSRSVKQF